MTFPFGFICDLLEELHSLCLDGKQQRAKDAIRRWFATHRALINSLGRCGHALLSTLLPDRRTDRVYSIQTNRLEFIIKRSQRLGKQRFERLRRYRQAGVKLDLGDCVQDIWNETWTQHHLRRSQVTIEDIDRLLDGIAANNKFSSPALRANKEASGSFQSGDLEGLYARLSPVEAKWFTRLVLKDYRPVELDESWVLQNYDARLPQILKVKDDFFAAMATLQVINDASLQPGDGTKVLQYLRPTLGTKVSRVFWRKGRSIKHCLEMGRGRMSVEKKIDGEYCQIHIDLSRMRARKEQCIQIFSKSGKDSTEDRKGLFGPILDSLDIGLASCKLSKGCILEGELVVYNDVEQKIMPFHRIRNYVFRRGVQLKTALDSPPRAYEHLMIVYYDVLLIDDESLLGVRHSDRFERLTRLVSLSRGRAELVNRHVIDFSSRYAASDLRNMFARTITARQEGLVLKPDDPFIDLSNSTPFSGSPIKLKKEYVGNFGDVGDFAVVAARYDPLKAKSMRVNNVKWTHFFVGCLTNKSSLSEPGSLPEFTIVSVVEVNETQMKTITTFSNPAPVPFKENCSLKLSIPSGVTDGKAPTVVFTNPLVFDIRCFDFDNCGNVGFKTPRFPVVSKIHFDRDFRDTITFSELQEMAEIAPTEDVMEDSQELKTWIAALEAADPRGIAVDAASQESVSTVPAPTPQQSTQNTTQRLSQVALSPSLGHKSARIQPSSNPLEALTPPPSSLPESDVCETATGRQRIEYSSHSPSRASTQTPANKRKLEEGSKHGSPAKRIMSSPSRKATSPRRDSLNWSQSQREPLTEMKINRSPHNSQTAQGVSSFYEISDPNEMENARDLCRQRTNSKTTSCSSQPGKSTRPLSPEMEAETDAARCVIAGSSCRLRDVRVMVTPEVLRNSANIKSLLREHGIRDFFTDYVELVPSGNEEFFPRMLCLVVTDSEEDRAALKKIKMERDRGQEVTTFIEVYDWRVINAVADLEAVHAVGCGQCGDPWQRWRVGFI